MLSNPPCKPHGSGVGIGSLGKERLQLVDVVRASRLPQGVALLVLADRRHYYPFGFFERAVSHFVVTELLQLVK